MRQLATVRTVRAISPIEGADNIELAHIDDWQCVIKKGELKAMDLCVYFEVDSLLPLSPIFDFLSKGSKPKSTVVNGKTYTGHRLKTVRLRGQLSQGLALPLETLGMVPGLCIEGADVSEDLGVVKYEAPIPVELSGKIKGLFPSFIPKTDEERVQNIGELVLNNLHLRYYVTEKLDGTSTTYYKRNGEVGACSRNLDFLETEGNTFWRVGREMGIFENLPDNYAVQGELVGSSIQKNPYKLTGQRFFAYNVWDIDGQRYLDFEDMIDFLVMHEMDFTVPILYTDYTLPSTIQELLLSADGNSLLNPETKREGIVIRPMNERRETVRGSRDQRYSFKVISNDYLLTEEL